MKFYSTKKTLGLTLIELLVTIAIIIILASVGVPSYNKFMANERFAVAINELYSAYRYARNEAIKTSSPITLEASGGAWTNGWQVKNNSTTVLLVSRIPHSSIVISGAALTVTGMGSLSGNSASFTVSDENKTRRLCVLASGQSVLQDGACS